MMRIAEMSVYLTVTAVLILVFKRIFKEKLSAKWQLWIWALLLVRLFVPQLPESNISVFNAIPTVSQNEYSAEYDSSAAIDIPAQTAPTTAPRVEEIHISDTNQDIVNKKICEIIWLIGACGLFVYFAGVYAAAQIKSRKTAERADDQTNELLSECCKKLGIKRKVRVCFAGESPMLMGFVKPKIILPKGYEDGEKRNIFLHELCHLKGDDVLIIWAAIMLLCLNWFNPVMWYSFFVLRRDIEIYCDERVLEYCDSRKEYANLLLKTALSKNKFVAGTTSLQNGEKEIARRIKKIAFFKKPKLVWSVILIAAAVALGAVCCTNAAYTDCGMSEERQREFSLKRIGSTMAEIDYADSERVIFHYIDGIFVYNIEGGYIEKAFDLSLLNCAAAVQGDVGVTVQTNGRKILVTNYGEDNEYDDYIIDVADGKAKKTKQTTLKNGICNFADTLTALPDAKGWYSEKCVLGDGKVWYLSIESTSYFDSMYISERDTENNAEKVWYPFLSGKTDELYGASTLIGDAPGVRSLLDMVNFAGYGIGSIELKTDSTPYGLTVYFTMDNMESLKYIDERYLNKSSALVFALVENVEDITYKFVNMTDAGNTIAMSISHNRSDHCKKGGMDYFTKSVLDSAAKSKESFSEFYAKVMAINFDDEGLYSRVYSYLEGEFDRVYSRYYDDVSIAISNWREQGNEAEFFCTMTYTHKNKDPDSVDYIKKAKINGDGSYDKLYKEYLEPQEANYELKIVDDGGNFKMYSNVAPRGAEWEETKLDDFVGG